MEIVGGLLMVAPLLLVAGWLAVGRGTPGPGFPPPPFPVHGWRRAALPVGIAALAWPALTGFALLGAFPEAVLLGFPVTLLACGARAWETAGPLAGPFAARLGWSPAMARGVVFTGQLMGIIGSALTFSLVVGWAESRGFKVGWS